MFENEPDPAPIDDSISHNQPVILIVEDEPFLLSSISRVLRANGFIAPGCGLWAKAPSLVRKVEPDLVLIDYDMPSLNGADVRGILGEALGPDAKVLLFSAADEEELKKAAVTVGADGFISKTISSEELVRRLKGFLGVDGGDSSIEASGTTSPGTTAEEVLYSGK